MEEMHRTRAVGTLETTSDSGWGGRPTVSSEENAKETKSLIPTDTFQGVGCMRIWLAWNGRATLERVIMKQIPLSYKNLYMSPQHLSTCSSTTALTHL